MSTEYPRSIVRSYQFTERLRWQIYTELQLNGETVYRQFNYPSARPGAITLNAYDNQHRIYTLDSNAIFELIEPILETRWTWRAQSTPSTSWLREEYEFINISVYNDSSIQKVEAVEYQPPPYDPENPQNYPNLPEPPNMPAGFDIHDPTTWPPTLQYLEVTRTDYDPTQPNPSVSTFYVIAPYSIPTVGLGFYCSGTDITADTQTQPLPTGTLIVNRYETLTLRKTSTVEFIGRFQFSYPEILRRRPVEEWVESINNMPDGWPLGDVISPVQSWTVA